MIGRGSLGKPWIFRDIISFIKSETNKKISLSEILNICFEHVSLLKKYKSNKVVINLSKKHLSYYIKSFNNSSTFRKEIMKSERIEDIESILRSIN